METSNSKQFLSLISIARISLLLFLCLCRISAKSQSDCPSGYSMRKVKCSGKITEKCVPNDYSCKSCWIVSWKPCPGSSSGGDDTYNSYEAAFSNAERKANGSNWASGKCTWWDNNPGQYTIYIDDATLCGTLNPSCALCEDLKLKVAPFLDRFNAEIKAYKNMINGNPNKMGATYKEYSKLIEQSEQRIKQLDFQLKSLNDKNYDVVNSLFEELEKDQQELKNIFSSISSGQPSQANSSNESNSACDLYWSDWVQCLTSPKGSVSYRIQFSKKFCGCGYQFVQIKHSFSYKVSIDLELEGWDCDGKYLKSKFNTATISSNEISADNGNWHRFGKIKGAFAVKVKGNDGNGNREISIGPNGAQEYINGKSVAEIENEKRQEQINKNVIKTEQEGKEINKIVEGNTSGISQTYIKSMTELNNQAARSGLTVDNTALRLQAEKLAEINRQHQAISQSIDLIGKTVMDAYSAYSAASLQQWHQAAEKKQFMEKAYRDLRGQYSDSMKFYKEVNVLRYAEIKLNCALTFFQEESILVNGINTYLKHHKNFKYLPQIDPLRGFMFFNAKYNYGAHYIVPIEIDKYKLPSYCVAPIQNVYTNEYERKNIYQKALLNLRLDNRKLSFHALDDDYYLKPKYNKNLVNAYDENKAISELSQAIASDSITNAVDVFDYYLCLMWHNCLKSKNGKAFEDIVSILSSQLSYLRKADLIFDVCQKESLHCLESKEKIKTYFKDFNPGEIGGVKYINYYEEINEYYYLRALYFVLKIFPELEKEIVNLINKSGSKFRSPLRVYYNYISVYPNNIDINREVLQQIKNEYYATSLEKNAIIGFNAKDIRAEADQLEELIKYIQSKLN